MLSIRFWLFAFLWSIQALGYCELISGKAEFFRPLSGDKAKEAETLYKDQIGRIKKKRSILSANLLVIKSKVLTEKDIKKLKEGITTTHVDLIQIDAEALQYDRLSLSLPNGKRLEFANDRVETRGADDFTWFGNVSAGNAILVAHNGKIAGTLWHELNQYQIEPIANSDLHALTYAGGSPSAISEKKSSGKIRSADKNIKPVVIDVLIAYTPAAKAAVPDMHALIQLALAETNQSYINSAVHIRLNMVDSFEADYSEKDKSFDQILNEFTDSPEVNARRDKSGADMAALIAADQSGRPGLCGLSNATLANAANAFAIINQACATASYALAHEFGHLQGARHNLRDDPENKPFKYGHGYQYKGKPSWRTIMAQSEGCSSEGGCPRLGYWSNPNVYFNGVPMGVKGYSDDARVLNETAKTIANFRKRSD